MKYIDERNWVTACKDSLDWSQARRRLPRPVSPLWGALLGGLVIAASIGALVLLGAWLASK